MSKSIDKRDEALKLAMKALAASDDFLFNYHYCEPNNEREVDAYSEVRANNMAAWEAVREALNATLAKQPAQQQEPVAWANPNDLQNFDMKVRTNGGPLHTVPLYTSPPANANAGKPWVGLTDAQIGAVAADIWGSILIAPQSHQAFARAIEAAHGIKGNA